MENSFQTSFIPKKPIVPNGASGTNSLGGKTTSISIVVTVFILIALVVATVGLYFYRDYLQKNKEDLSATLFKMRGSFDNDTIVALEMYDKKSTVAKQVLGGHIVLSPLFDTMNELTLSSIQYTKFDHSTNDGVFSVKMSGIARDYKSIALQADVFNTKKGSMFKDVIFSNLTKDKSNNVTFDLEFDVDPALLSYSNHIVNTVAIPEVSTSGVVGATDTTLPASDANLNTDTSPLQTTSNPQ
ncbi:hypothetical protein A2467_00400 [Candidatus Nomurabacteria bacterium RIFOXYC2_FULL_36_8]|nr:MAG: hypothetical protein UR97_C0002G0095 [Candidatus Nomurabacteria bacterium GW2011_GWE2_36_115]KKP94500.1 MAG: hypothetical protein US00_C0001G0094 [Candidatus Nomurabacteria bacterium GW2011_GWF2_36_126]KKP96962.1 MAG: hypothetical protein US04_C0001G0465 [Candidatus Nomurabacteria bacterium GW2011_GWD2_36_14]KKP99434.1 MAG: hypothetical protein US08_C0001G0116 [Candidatus Nomurabacteria bacterium GW2011_GWF2_36_19]KKQ05710.1 MAG: hypothetical protein US17_C0002G0094 [Candidatus Nomuraba